MQNLFRGKTAGSRCFQILIGLWFGFFVLQSVFAFPVTIVGDVSPTTVVQVQQATQQTTIQTSMAIDTKQSRIQQYLEYARQAQRWIETVNHYSAIVAQNVQKFTSLRGILSVVEKNLGLNDDTLRAISDIGQAIRATLSLKSQFLNMIQSKLAMIQSMENRVRNGILDPQADLADLEDYLKRTMGRDARAVLLTRERLARVNPELTRLTEEWQKVHDKRIFAEKEKRDLQEKLQIETSLSNGTRQVSVGDDGSSTVQTGRVSVSSDGVSAIVARIGVLELLIEDYLKQERELEEKIQKIYQKAHSNFDQVYFTGEKWTEYMDGWTALQAAKNQSITGLIDSYGTRGRVVPTPTP